MAGPPHDATRRRKDLSRVLKALRRRRGLAASDVARALGMPLRSYEYFESGRGRLNVERVHRAAEVLNADPFAILLALDIGSPDFALRCADNKLVTVLVMALQDFDANVADQMAQLDPATLMAGFTRAFDDLARQARERGALAEGWRRKPENDGGPSGERP